LQHVPEATVDYWCNDLSVIEYERTLLEVVTHRSSDFHFVIKEHPNVLGMRHPALYDKLNTIEGVTICPTNVNSNTLVAASDAVLVWTGSVGFEAALRG